MRFSSQVLEAYDLGMAPYPPVQDLQARLRNAVSAQKIPGALLLLEHSPVVTLGAHAPSSDVPSPATADLRGIPVVRSERGGQTTLHAPGQLISYPILRIPRRDLRAYVHDLEEVLMLVLIGAGLDAERLPGRPGLYLGGLKIASIGLKCQQGVASHGSALNVNVDLSLFDLIVSCGDPHLRQTSMQQAAGRNFSMQTIKTAYLEAFRQVFGLTLSPLQPGSQLLQTDT